MKEKSEHFFLSAMILCFIVLVFVCFIMMTKEKDTERYREMLQTLSNATENLRTFESDFTKISNKFVTEKGYLSRDWQKDSEKILSFHNDSDLYDLQFSGSKVISGFSVEFKSKYPLLCKNVLTFPWKNLVFMEAEGKKFVGKNIPATEYLADEICSKKTETFRLIFK